MHKKTMHFVKDHLGEIAIIFAFIFGIYCFSFYYTQFKKSSSL